MAKVKKIKKMAVKKISLISKTAKAGIKKIINLIIFLSFILFFYIFIYSHKQTFLKPTDLKKLEQNYQTSQFNPDPEKQTTIIQDEDLYAYAGYKYLTTGDLSQINIEHPPLGKYLIGLSLLIFKNQNVGQLLWGGLFLFFLYQLSLKILDDKTLALLTTFLFSLEKIFQEQLLLSLLDLILGVFLLGFLWSLKKSLLTKQPKFSIISGLLLGGMASIKYPTIALVALTTGFGYFLLRKDRYLVKKMVLISLTAGAVFLLTYLPFFLKHSPQEFITLQIKALRIHLSHVPEYPKGQVFKVLFFNKWLSWWGEKGYINTNLWSFTWPVLTLSFFISLVRLKKNLLIKLWSFLYLLFLASRLFFPRYLFLLLPFFYIHFFSQIKSFSKNHPFKKK